MNIVGLVWVLGVSRSGHWENLRIFSTFRLVKLQVLFGGEFKAVNADVCIYLLNWKVLG